MEAIVRNDLAELEDSIAAQEDLSQQLSALAGHLREEPSALKAAGTSLQAQIEQAGAELHRLNLRYSILLDHSSRSVAIMASLFNSFRGQIQEGTGAGSKQQTWSCQM
jgi:septal ring factor EnvC (AmiA/AmiB activator)